MSKIEIKNKGEAYDILNRQIAIMANTLKNKTSKLYQKFETYQRIKEQIIDEYPDFNMSDYDNAADNIVKIKLGQQNRKISRIEKELEKMRLYFEKD